MKTCERCKKDFECSAQTPDKKCWCFGLEKTGEKVDIPSEYKDCLCAECLKLFIKAKSEDYYYDENGYMVFTKEYHLKRGSCCGSGCTNCPY